jgi:hypothetical protein
MNAKPVLLLPVLLVSFASAVGAQDNVGGHLGFVIPWVTHANDTTTTIADRFTIGFPIGVTFKGPSHLNVDLEMIPTIAKSTSNLPQQVGLTIDPGVIYSADHGIALGLRAAFDVNSSQFGFIPLINKSWPINNQGGLLKAYFIEADVPIKFNRLGGNGSADTTAITFATHFGVAF